MRRRQRRVIRGAPQDDRHHVQGGVGGEEPLGGVVLAQGVLKGKVELVPGWVEKKTGNKLLIQLRLILIEKILIQILYLVYVQYSAQCSSRNHP